MGEYRSRPHPWYNISVGARRPWPQSVVLFPGFTVPASKKTTSSAMPSNDNPFADDSDALAGQPGQAAPAQWPLLQYFKTLTQKAFTDPMGAPPPFPYQLPNHPALTSAEEAVPYRATPRSYDAARNMSRNLDALVHGQPVSEEDLLTSALGSSPIMAPLRGIGDIFNYIRGTSYPQRPTPSVLTAPASPSSISM